MMNFERIPSEIFTIGSTPNGNVISYVEIRESNLLLMDPKSDIEALSQKPSEITLYSTVEFILPMMDAIEASKILKVKKVCNDNKQIVIYPLFSFDFSKLQNVLFDLSEKFKL